MSSDVLRRPNEFYDAYVFDMDGTIYLGDHLLPGAARLINELRRRELPIRYLSNNPTKDPEMYARKLTKLGLPTPVEDISNTIVTTTKWLLANHPDAVLFPISEEPLKRALVKAGFTVSDDPEEIDIVIASYDRTFDYRKLQIAFDALWFHRRARLVATNPDRFCPFPGGRGEPDAACITAAITAGTGVECSAVFGKPERGLFDIIAQATGLDPARTVMVGDRLSTDISFARRHDLTGVLVLTGETDRRMLAAAPPDLRPDIVLDRIDDLLTLDRRPVEA